MNAEVSNASEKPARVLSLIYFDAQPGIQFGRRAWIPPHARRTIRIPVLIPENIITDKSRRGEFIRAQANVLLIDQTGEVEKIIRSDGRQLADQTFFSVDTSREITVQIADSAATPEFTVDGFSDEKFAGLALKSLRVFRGLGDSVPNLSDSRVPIAPTLLETADQMVIRGNRLATDGTGRTAIRQWVQNGGQLWLMLDTMDEDTVRLLLGDACPVEYVDQVGLIEFESSYPVSPGSVAGTERQSGSPERQSHSQPVQFVRTIAEDCEPIMTINGWPSIFKRKFGHGTIVFSTIGARALVRKRQPGEKVQGMAKALLIPRAELKAISKHLFDDDTSPIVTETTLAPFVEKGVGYQVPGRSFIFLVLAAFCGVLLAVGGWLYRTENSHQLVWVAPLTVICATVPLIVMGKTSKQAIPPTVVETQFIEAIPASDDLFVRGLAGVFQNETSNRPFTIRSTSVFVPDRTGIKDTWRMVWNDLNSWQWENVSMPSGIRLIPFSATIHATDPVQVYGTFDSIGFRGNIKGPVTNLRDAIVASSTHVSLGIELNGNDLRGPVESAMPPGQYSLQNVLTDEQVQHQSVYRSMMDFDLGSGIKAEQNSDVVITDKVRKKSQDANAVSLPKRKYPSQASLLGWSDPVDVGFELNPDAIQKGSALWVVPIQFLHPEPGTTIRIPSVFLPYDGVEGPGREGRSVAFNPRLGIWQKHSRGTNSTIRFQLPTSVLPFEPSLATLKLRINAPQRTVEIQSGQVATLVPVGSSSSPIGLIEFSIDDPAALQLDENGGFHVRLAVSDLEMSSGGLQTVNWKIDYVELQMDGKYLPID